jgi:RNA polymerase sigma-70 factor (ECF subfamily)
VTNDARRPTEAASLAKRIRDGDRTAEDELVRAFGKKVFFMLYARIRNPDVARDISQDVFLSVLQGLREGKLLDEDQLGAYLRGTARNLSNNYLRSRTREPVFSDPPDQQNPVTPVDLFEDRERRNLVSRALSRLDRTDRRILSMTLSEGLQPRRIAERLGLKSEVVRQRKSRAIRKIVAEVRKRSRS